MLSVFGHQPHTTTCEKPEAVLEPEGYEKHLDTINSISREEIGRLMRFHPCGEPHPYFDSTLPYFKLLNDRFQKLGGWDAGLSKHIGWDRA
jgi:hypothetical protein